MTPRTRPSFSMRYTFPRRMRIQRKIDYDRVFARKNSVSDGWLILYACENALTYPRLGLSVSRKLGNAVTRNRYKRLLREAFRLSQHQLPVGVDLVLIPKPRQQIPTFDELKKSLLTLANQALERLSSRPTNANSEKPQ